MKTYILVGSEAVACLREEDWKNLEEIILEDFNGDLIAWDKEIDSVGELLNSLNGWSEFVELSDEDLKEIEANTKIVIV